MYVKFLVDRFTGYTVLTPTVICHWLAGWRHNSVHSDGGEKPIWNIKNEKI